MQHCEHVKQAEAEAAVVIALCFRWHAIMLTFAQSRRPHRAVGLPVESALFFVVSLECCYRSRGKSKKSLCDIVVCVSMFLFLQLPNNDRNVISVKVCPQTLV